MMTAADKAVRRPATREELVALIQESDEWAIGGLLALYAFQTSDEQERKSTSYENFIGFNNTDARILTSIAQQYKNGKQLTRPQLDLIKRAIPKYADQLERFDTAPIPNNIFKLEERPRPGPASRLVKLSNDQIIVTFSYDPSDVARVKTLSGRRWNPDCKRWSALLSIKNVRMLKGWGFNFSDELEAWFASACKVAEVKKEDVKQIPGLYPFQCEGVAWIDAHDGRALIADEMGLGKTIQVLGWLSIHPELRPAIIVVPASLKLNWAREAAKWVPGDFIHVISGTSGDIQKATIYIINYDILKSRVDQIKSLKPQVVIADEVHFTKNGKAQRTKAFRVLCKGVKNVVALSGTPIVNRPVEFFNILNILRPDVWPRFRQFAEDYCAPKYNGFGWDYTGSTNTEKLHKEVMKYVMIRHLKKDVLKDLPPKVRSVVPMEIVNRRDYRKAETDIISWIREQEGGIKADRASRARVLVEFEKLKQLSVRGKIAACLDWIRDYIEVDGKLVVFCTHHETIDTLMAEFGDMAVKVDGRDNMKQRQEAVDRFQENPKIRLFVGNIKAAGVGLTLTAASATCTLELGWTPGDHDQAEDRVHRIGQKANSVNAYYLLAEGTVEEEIALLIDKKRQVLGQVLDGKDVEDSALLTELMSRMLEKVA